MHDGLIIGVVADIRARRLAVATANPHLARKLGVDLPVVALKRRPVQPIEPEAPRFKRGTPGYIVAFVASQFALPVSVIHSPVSSSAIRNARAAIANLCLEFCPRYSERAVSASMGKTETLAHYYRARHQDRRAAYPEYANAYDRCHAILTERFSQTAEACLSPDATSAGLDRHPTGDRATLIVNAGATPPVSHVVVPATSAAGAGLSPAPAVLSQEGVKS